LGFHISPTNEVVVAFEQNEPVALVVFMEYYDTGELWIHLGYCQEQYRRKGYYRACIEELKRLAAERGYAHITTATHPENVAATESIKSRGGTVQYVSYVFPI
jgi:RimJ/RimL family protein N-acetyltransferase